MNLNLNKPSDSGCDIANHPLANEIRNKFQTGQATASSPVPGIGSFKWTSETDEKFQSAMNRVHNLRKKNKIIESSDKAG